MMMKSDKALRTDQDHCRRASGYKQTIPSAIKARFTSLSMLQLSCRGTVKRGKFTRLLGASASMSRNPDFSKQDDLNMRYLSRRTAWTVVTFMCATVLGIMTVSLRQRGLGFTSSVGALLGLGVWQVFLQLIQWARRSQFKSSSTQAQIRAAIETLADQGRDQWSSEVALQDFTDPMAVQWVPAGCELADYMDIVGDSVDGSTSNIAGMLKSFRNLNYQRLVIVGPAGAGKTVLAELLALEMLRTRQPGDPVPVFFPLSSWNPRRESLRTWLQRRIGESYSALRDSSSYGPTALKDLTENYRLMPILDGLDELPATCVPRALKRINEAIALFGGIVVTCKTDVFDQATREEGIIKGAAVIEARPIETSAVIAFLRNTTSPADLHRWHTVFDFISESPESPLATSLSSPLMTSLVGTIYADRSTNPAELIDSKRFPTANTIETHLINSLIPSLLQQDRGRENPIRSWDWDSYSATKWLGFLAEHLQSLNTYDFSWWNLYRALPIFSKTSVQRRAFLPASLTFILVTASYLFSYGIPYSLLTALSYALTVGAACLLAQRAPVGSADPESRGKHFDRMSVIGIIAAVAFGVPISVRTVLSSGVSVGLRMGVAAGIVAGIVVVLGANIAGIPTPPECPRRVDFHFRGRASSLLRTLGTGIRAGIVLGVVTGVLAIFRHPNLSGSALWNAVGSGVIVGLICGIGCWLISWTRTPVRSDEARSPAATLRGDRTAVFLLSTLLSLTLGGAFGLTARLTFDLPGVAANAIIGVLIGLLSGAWPLYCITSNYLALRSRLPFGFITFLDECHQLGILRQVGPVYQFRHAKLQQHLAKRINVSC